RGGIFYFFFQAEDGIRDGHVTGVQTCALPISVVVVLLGDRGRSHRGLDGEHHRAVRRQPPDPPPRRLHRPLPPRVHDRGQALKCPRASPRSSSPATSSPESPSPATKSASRSTRSSSPTPTARCRGS